MKLQICIAFKVLQLNLFFQIHGLRSPSPNCMCRPTYTLTQRSILLLERILSAHLEMTFLFQCCLRPPSPSLNGIKTAYFLYSFSRWTQRRWQPSLNNIKLFITMLCMYVMHNYNQYVMNNLILICLFSVQLTKFISYFFSAPFSLQYCLIKHPRQTCFSVEHHVISLISVSTKEHFCILQLCMSVCVCLYVYVCVFQGGVTPQPLLSCYDLNQ